MKRITATLLILLLLCGCAMKQPPAPLPTETARETQALPGDFAIHYIDVGQADAALVLCDGEAMLIDGGNVADGQLLVSYLQQQGVTELSAVVCSHAHEDHVGGLASVLAVYPTEAVYAPTRTYASNCFDDFLYYTDQQGLTVTIPAPGDSFFLGSAEVTVLGPVKSYPDPNDTSIVLRIVYGDTAFLFTGDMETGAEGDLLDHWDGSDLTCDVLKVGHHGSSTSSSYRFLYEIDPDYAVILVGADNTYGHPHEEVVSRLRDAAVPIFRTDTLGTVVASSDGTQVTLTWENQNADPAGAEPAEMLYIGNKKSRKLHLPGCGSLPAEQNRVEFADYDQALAQGYTPCNSCMGG